VKVCIVGKHSSKVEGACSIKAGDQSEGEMDVILVF